jgi:hypothetical protein
MTRHRAIVPNSQPGDTASQNEVELPDGTIVPLDAKNNEELTQIAASVIGVDPQLLSVLDEEGNVQAPASPTPKQAKIIATPNYGGDIDFRQLKIDMLKALNSMSYSEAFELRLLEPDKHNPFRVYLELFGKLYIARVGLEDYPFTNKYPQVQFEQLLPPCPLHPANRHPNVDDSGHVCFGKTILIKGTRIVGLLNTLDNFLHDPKHKAGYSSSCRAA